jgi:AcrR family transcriptional regulator
MTAVAARHGYADASVARVIEQAGVSRATFYKHFADKEACFLAAYERAAERIEKAMPRIEAEYSPAIRVRELIEDLLANIARDPAAARILLLEALAGGPEVRRAHERFMGKNEATFERWLDGPGEAGYRLEISGRAIMEGIGGILLIRSFRGETARITKLRDDLIAWVYAYAVPEDRPRIRAADWRRVGRALTPEPQPTFGADALARKLPRGRAAVAATEVSGTHRERILAAVARLARTKGYTAMTVADIVKMGSVTREAFYDHFRSKEDAFLAAQTAGLEASVAASAASFFSGEDWPTRVWGGLHTLLSYISAQPDLVYIDVIESFAAGTAAIRRSFDNRMAYGLFLEDGYHQSPAAERLPHLCSEAISGAVLGLLRWQVAERRIEDAIELLPETAYVALAPFIGPVAAIELIEAKLA